MITWHKATSAPASLARRKQSSSEAHSCSCIATRHVSQVQQQGQPAEHPGNSMLHASNSKLSEHQVCISEQDTAEQHDHCLETGSQASHSIALPTPELSTKEWTDLLHGLIEKEIQPGANIMSQLFTSKQPSALLQEATAAEVAELLIQVLRSINVNAKAKQNQSHKRGKGKEQSQNGSSNSNPSTAGTNDLKEHSIQQQAESAASRKSEQQLQGAQRSWVEKVLSVLQPAVLTSELTTLPVCQLMRALVNCKYVGIPATFASHLYNRISMITDYTVGSKQTAVAVLEFNPSLLQQSLWAVSRLVASNRIPGPTADHLQGTQQLLQRWLGSGSIDKLHTKLQAVCAIAVSFAHLHVPLQPTTLQLLEQATLPKLQQLPPVLVAELVWALACQGWKPSTDWMRASLHVVNSAANLPPEKTVQTLWAVSLTYSSCSHKSVIQLSPNIATITTAPKQRKRKSCSNEQLVLDLQDIRPGIDDQIQSIHIQSLISGTMKQLDQNLHKMPGASLATIAWALAQLLPANSNKPSILVQNQAAFFNKLFTAFTTKLGTVSPHIAVTMLWSVAMLGITLDQKLQSSATALEASVSKRLQVVSGRSKAAVQRRLSLEQFVSHTARHALAGVKQVSCADHAAMIWALGVIGWKAPLGSMLYELNIISSRLHGLSLPLLSKLLLGISRVSTSADLLSTPQTNHSQPVQDAAAHPSSTSLTVAIDNAKGMPDNKLCDTLSVLLLSACSSITAQLQRYSPDDVSDDTAENQPKQPQSVQGTAANNTDTSSESALLCIAETAQGLAGLLAVMIRDKNSSSNQIVAHNGNTTDNSTVPDKTDDIEGRLFEQLQNAINDLSSQIISLRSSSQNASLRNIVRAMSAVLWVHHCSSYLVVPTHDTGHVSVGSTNTVQGTEAPHATSITEMHTGSDSIGGGESGVLLSTPAAAAKDNDVFHHLTEPGLVKPLARPQYPGASMTSRPAAVQPETSAVNGMIQGVVFAGSNTLLPLHAVMQLARDFEQRRLPTWADKFSELLHGKSQEWINSKNDAAAQEDEGMTVVEAAALLQLLTILSHRIDVSVLETVQKHLERHTASVSLHPWTYDPVATSVYHTLLMKLRETDHHQARQDGISRELLIADNPLTSQLAFMLSWLESCTSLSSLSSKPPSVIANRVMHHGSEAPADVGSGLPEMTSTSDRVLPTGVLNDISAGKQLAALLHALADKESAENNVTGSPNSNVTARPSAAITDALQLQLATVLPTMDPKQAIECLHGMARLGWKSQLELAHAMCQCIAGWQPHHWDELSVQQAIKLVWSAQATSIDLGTYQQQLDNHLLQCLDQPAHRHGSQAPIPVPEQSANKQQQTLPMDSLITLVWVAADRIHDNNTEGAEELLHGMQQESSNSTKKAVYMGIASTTETTQSSNIKDADLRAALTPVWFSQVAGLLVTAAPQLTADQLCTVMWAASSISKSQHIKRKTQVDLASSDTEHGPGVDDSLNHAVALFGVCRRHLLSLLHMAFSTGLSDQQAVSQNEQHLLPTVVSLHSIQSALHSEAEMQRVFRHLQLPKDTGRLLGKAARPRFVISGTLLAALAVGLRHATMDELITCMRLLATQRIQPSKAVAMQLALQLQSVLALSQARGSPGRQASMASRMPHGINISDNTTGSLSAEQLVEICSLVVQHRPRVYMAGKTKAMLVNACIHSLPTCNSQQVVVMLKALADVRAQISGRKAAVMLQAIDKAVRDADLGLTPLVSLLCSMALLSAGQDWQPAAHLLQRCCNIMQRGLTSMSGDDIAWSLWALARMEYKPSNQQMAHMLNHAQHIISNCRFKTVATLIYSLAELGYRPSDSWLQDVFDNTLGKLQKVSAGTHTSRTPRRLHSIGRAAVPLLPSIARLLWALATLRVEPPATWLSMCQHVAGFALKTASRYDLTLLAVGCAVLGPTPAVTASWMAAFNTAVDSWVVGGDLQSQTRLVWAWQRLKERVLMDKQLQRRRAVTGKLRIYPARRVRFKWSSLA